LSAELASIPAKMSKSGADVVKLVGRRRDIPAELDGVLVAIARKRVELHKASIPELQQTVETQMAKVQPLQAQVKELQRQIAAEGEQARSANERIKYARSEIIRLNLQAEAILRRQMQQERIQTAPVVRALNYI
jgi:chromosome segregation ATPase